MTVVFLLSLTGVEEWIIGFLFFIFVLVFPVVAILYYMETKKLRKENNELLERLMERK